MPFNQRGISWCAEGRRGSNRNMDNSQSTGWEFYRVESFAGSCYAILMIPAFLHKYFWDTDAKKLDVKKSAPYIIERILEYGDRDAAQWMIQIYEREAVVQVLRRSRALSLKSASFWGFLLKVPKSRIVCLSKQFRTRSRVIWSR